MQTQLYQSQIHLSMLGFECQSNSSTGQLAIFNGVRSDILCASYCNQQPLCRYFDFDTWNEVCRIFKDGSIVASASVTSRVGSVRYMPDLYSSYGQPCAWNTCQINRYLVCHFYNRCQCPPGLMWNTQICVGKRARKSSLLSIFTLPRDPQGSHLYFLRCSQQLLVPLEYHRHYGGYQPASHADVYRSGSIEYAEYQ